MTDTERPRTSPNWISDTNNGGIYYSPPALLERRLFAPTEQGHHRFPTPHIRSRRRRPQSIHIVSYPPGFVPADLRPEALAKEQEREKKKQKRRKREEERELKKQRRQEDGSANALGKLLSSLAPKPVGPPPYSVEPTRPRSSGTASLIRRLSAYRIDEEPADAGPVRENENMTRSHAATIAGPMRPPLGPSFNVPAPHRNSMISVRSAKSAVTQLVTEMPKPVATGGGVTCSILLAEPNVFLSGFDHDNHRDASRRRTPGPAGTSLLRGKLQLNVSKNIKIKAVELMLVGKARTEWPEGIPPAKTEYHEEESLRKQVLTFFNANASGDTWSSEYGNQCTYTLKSASPRGSTPTSPSGSISRNSTRDLPTPRELSLLKLQHANSRSFSKGESAALRDSTAANNAKGYKIFYPGTYEYSFELPIDNHQLETTKLAFGSVKWELHATVERAGAFKPNLHGVKEVSIVRVPDQMSLETVEPISISRQWEDQMHYDIIISGKSFPLGTKIPIAFKITPLAKVQLHKLKVLVTESIEYWTNDRKVTRKDPARKILLLEKAAGRPLDPLYASSDIRVVSGGELSPQQRREAREAATRRRVAEAARRHVTPTPLPDPTENLLGDLDLGLESYWGSTEIEMNVQLPTCETMVKNKELRLHPDCSWKNVNVYHWIKIVMRISRADPEDPTGQRRRHFEISIDSPFTILNCRATQANTSLPEYTGPEDCMLAGRATACGCPDAATIATGGGHSNFPSPGSSTGALTQMSENSSNTSLPAAPEAVHLSSPGTPGSSTPTSSRPQSLAMDNAPRPIHLLRVPSYNPPAFDAELPPPPADAPSPDDDPMNLMTPPPRYDVIIGTPSVDGMADYFVRLNNYNLCEAMSDVAGGVRNRSSLTGEDEDDSDSLDDEPARMMTRTGRVTVANPRTPGGMRAPSRSLEIERPIVNLSLEALRNARVGGPAAV